MGRERAVEVFTALNKSGHDINAFQKSLSTMSPESRDKAIEMAADRIGLGVEAEAPPERVINRGESLLRGAQQGFSAGFSDEAAGVGAGLASVVRGPEPEERGGFFGAISRFKEGFKSGRDQEREEVAKARAANPKAFLAGDIGASVGTAFIPGALAAKAGARTAGALNTARGIAAVGAGEAGLRQLGEEEELTKGTLLRVPAAAAVGGALGFGGAKLGGAITRRFGATAKNAGKVADDIDPIATRVPAKAAKTLDEVTPPKVKPTREQTKAAELGGRQAEDVAYYQANKARIKKQPSLDTQEDFNLFSEIQRDIQANQDVIRDLSDAGLELLENSDVLISTKQIRKLWMDQIREFRLKGQAVTGAGKQAIRTLRAEANNLPAKEEFWDPIRMKEYLLGLRETENSFFSAIANPNAKPTLGMVQFGEVAEGRLNGLLKSVVPGYDDIMKPLAQRIRLRNEINQQLRSKNLLTSSRSFKTRVKKPIADFLAGNTTATGLAKEDRTVLTLLKDLGGMAGRTNGVDDYFTIVKDRLTFGRMFPDKVPIGDLEPAQNLFVRKLSEKRGGLAGDLGGAAFTAARNPLRGGAKAVAAGVKAKDEATERAFQTLVETPDIISGRIIGAFTDPVRAAGRSVGRNVKRAALPLGTRGPQGLSEFLSGTEN